MAAGVIFAAGTSAALTVSTANQPTFKVRLVGELYESRKTTSERMVGDCRWTTVGAGSVSITFRTTTPAKIRLRYSGDGGIEYSTHVVGSIIGKGSWGGSEVDTCGSQMIIGDCFPRPIRFGPIRTRFALASDGKIVFDQLKDQQLPTGAPCASVPSTLPPLGLALAGGQVSVDDLVNRRVETIPASGTYELHLPLAGQDLSGDFVQRVHWKLIFTRVRRP